MTHFKSVPLPDHVTIDVKTLMALRDSAVMLLALKRARVEELPVWQIAKFLRNNDPYIIDAFLGEHLPNE